MSKCTKPGGHPYDEDGGASRKFEKIIPKMYKDPILWAWLKVFFTPGNKFKTTHYLVSYVSRFSTS